MHDDEDERPELDGAVDLGGEAERLGAGPLEEAEAEEDEAGGEVEEVEPVVVHEQVGGQGLLAARVVGELVVVVALLKSAINL